MSRLFGGFKQLADKSTSSHNAWGSIRAKYCQKRESSLGPGTSQCEIVGFAALGRHDAFRLAHSFKKDNNMR